MIRKALVTAALMAALVAAIPAGAEEVTHSGTILLGRGSCAECSEMLKTGSVILIEMPHDSAYEVAWSPALPGNQLEWTLSKGQFGNPDILRVYAPFGTIGQSFEVLVTPPAD